MIKLTVQKYEVLSWWRRGVVVNALVVINEVTLHRAQLVLEWVTVCGRVNHLGMKPAIQVNSAWPSLHG